MAPSEQFVAATALPALLPTPPRSKMVPLLPTPCLIILPASFASPSQTKPGRADDVERWDAHKTGAGGATPPPPLTKLRAERGRGLCRADACNRWDSNKTASPSRSSTSSSSSSSEPFRRGSSSSSSRSPARSSSNRASSNERWDIHKKPRLQAGALDGKDRNAAMTMSLTTDKKISKPQNDTTKKIATEMRAEFAGPSFASPDPSMLPLPMFLMAH